MIHPAKKPMEGGFSLDKFMPNISPEDAQALADALDEANDWEAEFDSGITEKDLMDRLASALDDLDFANAKLGIMEDSWKTMCKIAHKAEGAGYDVGCYEVLDVFNQMRLEFLKLEGKA